jgi:hypothetical protein
MKNTRLLKQVLAAATLAGLAAFVVKKPASRKPAAVFDGRTTITVEFEPGDLARHISDVERRGAVLNRALPLIEAASFSVPPGDVEAIRAIPGVKTIH